ncbi:MAG: LysR family transcriptional regulator [Candidatus Accumulibacter sp.]|jgi:DNA-binding transcriptional LysR family regulator|nr:LysR family transcriptional regulator [Accumulibacter sp.]
MELRHLRYFLAIAEEGNFTRAAARLGIGQPPLSQQIKDLETEVGVRLFHRVPHGAELTEAGRAFLEGVKGIPSRTVDAVRAAQRASRGETGRLSLGFTGTAVLNPIVPACVREFRRAYPEVEISFDEANSIALLAGLLDGRLDVAILRPSGSDPPELDYHTLAVETLVAVLPAAHPRAQDKGAIDLASLRDEPMILTPRAIGTSLHDAALAACRNAGFEPRLGQPAPQIASILSLVSAEQGVSLVPEYMRQFNIAGVVFRKIHGTPPTVGLAIALQRTRPPRPANNFVALARSISPYSLE